MTGLLGYVSSPIEPSRVDKGAARVIDGEVAVHDAASERFFMGPLPTHD